MKLCLVLLALGSCASGACAARPNDKDVTGGGALVPWKNAQEVLDPDGSFVAIRIGQPEVLVYVNPSAGGRALRLRSPNVGCDAFPVAVAVGEVTGDDRPDILVFDPGCGNWLASSEAGTFEVRAWEATIPKVTTRHFLSLRDLDDNGLADVSASTSAGVEMLFRLPGEWRRSEMWFTAQPQTNAMAATGMLFDGPLPGTLLFQRGSSLEVIKVLPDRVEHESTRQQEALELLREFDGYDQLVSLASHDANCNEFGAAVGVFNDQPRVPRRLNLLSLTPTGYTATEVPTQGTQALMLAGLPLEAVTRLGLISLTGAQFQFELLAVRGCAAEPLGAWPIEALGGFTATPKTPDDMMINNAGERLLAMTQGDALRFQHYDGRMLHIYEVGADGSDFRERAQPLE